MGLWTACLKGGRWSGGLGWAKMREAIYRVNFETLNKNPLKGVGSDVFFHPSYFGRAMRFVWKVFFFHLFSVSKIPGMLRASWRDCR